MTSKDDKLIVCSKLGMRDNCCNNLTRLKANKLSPVTLLLNIVSKLHVHSREANTFHIWRVTEALIRLRSVVANRNIKNLTSAQLCCFCISAKLFSTEGIFFTYFTHFRLFKLTHIFRFIYLQHLIIIVKQLSQVLDYNALDHILNITVKVNQLNSVTSN